MQTGYTAMTTFLHRARRALVGDRAFYRAVLAIILPVIVQNSITNFVNFLDNLMVGALGDAEMSGVSVANQQVFVFNLTLFGGLSGPAIFGAQFYGAEDIEGLRNTFRIKLWESILLVGTALAAFSLWGEELISLFLQGEGDPALAEAILGHGQRYLILLLPGLPAFALSVCYAGTLREMGETRLPMAASVAAVATNALFNWLLIFGRLGFPALGVTGAAMATVLSRYVELGIVAGFTHLRRRRYTFIQGVYRTLRVPGSLLRRVLRLGAPLLANELLWSVGMSTLTAAYSLCGLAVVAALSISSTISNLFNAVTFAMGTAVSVVVGQSLGAGRFAEARRDAWRLMAFSVAAAVGMGVLLAAASPWIPLVYRAVTPEVRSLATRLLLIFACVMPLGAFANCAYFTLRSGGKTLITFIFDSGYMWAVAVPLAYLLVRGLGWPIEPTFATVEGANLLKCILGFLFVRSGRWVHNLARETGPREKQL